MECFEFTPSSEAVNICFLSQCPPNPLPKLLLLGRLEFPRVTNIKGNIKIIAAACS